MITYDRETLFDSVRTSLFRGSLNDGQVKGIEAILDMWERLLPIGDIRQLAYVLATPWWETANTMQPIEEYGKGRGRSYGSPSGPYGQIYYGRGFVQLTWLANYQKATTRLRQLGLLTDGQDLAKTPSLAMRIDVASAILIYGMLEGWFTGRKLSDYFTATVSDYRTARKIINGLDKADTIAVAAKSMFAALKASAINKAAAPPIVITPPAPAALQVQPPAMPKPPAQTSWLSRAFSYLRHA